MILCRLFYHWKFYISKKKCNIWTNTKLKDKFHYMVLGCKVHNFKDY